MNNSIARFLVVPIALSSLVAAACERVPVQQSAKPAGEWREFEGSWNASGHRRVLELGSERHASTIDLSGSMLLTGPDRPSAAFRAEAIALNDTQTGLVGRAVWTDDEGDHVYCELKGDAAITGAKVTGTIVSGSGRFQGVTGSFEFSWQSVIDLEDGQIQGRAVGLKGKYKIVQFSQRAEEKTK